MTMQRYVDSPNPSKFLETNPFGYQLNINHPEILPYYKRFKAWKNLGAFAISDAERIEFERYIINKVGV